MQALDCAIIGAGPAGMTAAIELSKGGAKVAVLDRGTRAGGQIYRAAAASPLPNTSALGPDYQAGAELIAAFERTDLTHFASSDAWHLGDDGRVLFSHLGETHELHCREMLLCPGAMERPMPIPGWTLPGVMTAGAAQVMLKSDATVAEGAVFAGSGPLLYLIVAQYLRLGVPVTALVDTTPRQNYLNAAPLLPRALRQAGQLKKGIALLREIRSAGIPQYRFAENLEVLGQNKAKGLRFTSGGQIREIAAETIFLHHGVQPNLNMTRAMDLAHRWNPQQLCWQVETDAFGQTSIQHISAAGDGAGIIGADGARIAGRLAALNILHRLGRLSEADRNRQATPGIAKLAAMAPFRAFIDRLYHPANALRLPQNPDTLVCRCEEQTLADLREGFNQGARDPNALKSLTRCGMGPCQGRQCGHMVTGLLSQWRAEPTEAVGYYRLRSPQRLLTLDELSRFQAVPAPTHAEAAE
ncbi:MULTISPECIES: FAD/NAD(P)-dependent oxidoreductase [unclassified Leisingera]|uniref:FAD/NAD(P)-dependent oxidoreductase n=1 Tax=unclassified Leisingera TaxID=2614906 RepID=UPI0002FD1501|nr:MULTISPECIES: NAD(P)/FAD-dependent oxidoreductase [unclassified Leisingera]KIC22959.1 pyridine nucleotide-disulfide oxidoreductase [Leisingera sp. ANG-S3]KIC52461.1 pyridine nucleotide-disulfide oxidoreductase [Leisingera sp. ANG-S]KID07478.1 pyridine nucleotide-disulfide oxidoreductase [Leisingera sp. ANG1]